MTSLNSIDTENSIEKNANSNKRILKQSRATQNTKSGVNLYLSKLLFSEDLISAEDTSQSKIDRSQNASRRKVEFQENNAEEIEPQQVQSPRKSVVLVKSTEKYPQEKTIQKPPEEEYFYMETTNFIDFSEFSCEDPQFQAYFAQFNCEPAQNNIIHDHQQELYTTLKRELKSGELMIEEMKPFPIKKRQRRPAYEQEKQMREKLQEKRQEALMKIKQIEEQELQLKRRVITTVQKPRRQVDLVMSRITQAIDEQQVKKAIQEYKKFHEEIQKRDEQAQKEREEQLKLEFQKQQELMRLKRQSRREEVKNNLKEIVERERVRKSIMEEWKAKDKQIRQKKYLYIEFNQRDKKNEEIKQMQTAQLLDRRRKNHQFDKDDIEKHQRRYEELLEERRQMSRSLVNSAMTHSSSRKKYETSKFHEFVVREMEEQKKKQLQKIMKVKQNEHKDKINKYQEKIDSEIKPNLHYKKFTPIPRAMSLEALEAKDRWNLGLKYLQKAKKLKMPEAELKILLTKREEEDKMKQSRELKDYKDYLKEIKKDIAYDPTQRKLDEILKNKRSYSNYETLKDVKYMSEYLVEKSKHLDQQKTMLAIKRKMDILNVLY